MTRFDEPVLEQLQAELHGRADLPTLVGESSLARDAADQLVVDSCLSRLGLGSLDPVAAGLQGYRNLQSRDDRSVAVRTVDDVLRGPGLPEPAHFVVKLLGALGRSTPTAREEALVSFARTIAARIVDGASTPIIGTDALRWVQLEDWDNLHRSELKLIARAPALRADWVRSPGRRDQIDMEIVRAAGNVAVSYTAASPDGQGRGVPAANESVQHDTIVQVVGAIMLAAARLEADIIKKVRQTDTLRTIIDTSVPECNGSVGFANRLIAAAVDPAYLRAGSPNLAWMMAAGYALRDVSRRRAAILHGDNRADMDANAPLIRYFYDASGKRITQEIPGTQLSQLLVEIGRYKSHLGSIAATG